ncbi:hypothetical protein OQA88_1551 [Cercophora sp. LCS_1]
MAQFRQTEAEGNFFSSYVDVGRKSAEKRLADLVAQAPGEQTFKDDDVPDLLYSVQYVNHSGKVIDTRVSKEPLDVLEFGTLQTADGKKPVIEIRTRVSAATRRSDHRRPSPPRYFPDSESDSYGEDMPVVMPPHRRIPVDARRPGDDLKVFRAEKSQMVIHSPYLCSALAAIVEYYPEFVSTGEGMIIDAPYEVLVHHWDALENYKSNQPASHDAEYAAITAKHINVLLSFLTETFSEKLSAEKNRWDNPSGPTATFELFWVLLKPGEIVFKEADGSLRAFVVSSAVRFFEVRGQEAYSVHMWNIVFRNNRLQRHMTELVLHSWNGEREIAGLPVIPAKYVKGGAVAMKEKQIELGKKFWDLAKQPSYREYDGLMRGGSRNRDRRGRLSGRVVVDCEGWEKYKYGQHGRDRSPPPRGPRIYEERQRGPPPADILPENLPRCSCKLCNQAKLKPTPSPYAGFENLDPKKDDLPANPDLYFLALTNSIPAFILGQRIWAHLEVEHLTPIRPDPDAFKYLVLDDEIKLTVKALIGKFASDDGKLSPWPSDFVKNKGEGRIFLLHGSPGVGKTCTAECIAELTKRPLLSITGGDLGANMYADSVEQSLQYFLKLGERYGALVLLDEADVYLEARRTRDLERNALVSVFLRALEYYKGVLFLTTNRVEAFDSAFTSRIHVALHYRKLGQAERGRIWVQNFERLERDSGGKCFVPAATRRYILDSPDVRELRLNGREIRNALQTAVALAETDAMEDGVETITVSEKHLRAVVKMSSGFKSFLKNKKAKRCIREESDEDGDEYEEDDEEEDVANSEDSDSERLAARW